jgi:hypothetical protein
MKTEFVLGAAMVAVLAASSAPAATLLFTYTTPADSGGSATWTQSSTPAVAAQYPNIYTDVVVTDGSAEPAGLPTYTFTSVYYANGGADGGFDIIGSGISPSGPQLFRGLDTAPVFATGVYSLDGGGTLTVTAAGAPEPDAWSMMLLGVAVMGGALRLRKSLARPRRQSGSAARA